MLRILFRFVRAALVFGLIVVLALAAGAIFLSLTARNPGDVPWGSIDLAEPPGRFTASKLAQLRSEPETCMQKLRLAGFAPKLRSARGQGQCRAADLVSFGARGRSELPLVPQGVTPSCPVFAGLLLWKWHVVAPAARDVLGSELRAITHFGTYSCRRIGGGDAGNWSEHATGNAIDIAAFELMDGRRVSVSGSWSDDGPEGKFLRRVRNGACETFTTVLSPDYNAAHADHLHLDQAQRGMAGFGACH